MTATMSDFVSATTTARTIWAKLRSHAFFDEVVSGWSDEEWKQNFRVSREMFKVMCYRIKPDYFNGKEFHSVVLRALEDCKYKFMNVYIGWPGSVDDTKVLANPILFNKCEDGTLLPNWTRNINGVDIPLLILGDPAYPLTIWLMKPYSDCGNLSRKQGKFNCRFSRARVVVENAFGCLKGRWHSLLNRNDGAVDFLPTYVTACCVLHNICEQYNDSFDEDWLVMDHETVTSEQTSVSSSVTTSTSSGTYPRNTV